MKRPTHTPGTRGSRLLTGLALACFLAFGQAAAWADGPQPVPAGGKSTEAGDQSEAPSAPPTSPPAKKTNDTPHTILPSRDALPQPGDAVQLIFTSGDAAEGKLIEVKDDGYRVLIGGLEVTVANSDLEDIIVLPPVEERFRQMRDLIAPDDTAAMSALANWAYARGLHEQALEVVNEALTYKEHDPKLTALRDMLQATVAMDKIKAERKARDDKSGHEDEPTPAPSSADSGGGADRVARPWPNFPLLTDEQVNLIKVYEVDLRRPPRIIIDRTTIDALIQNYASNPLIPTTREGRDAFKRRSPAEILDVMFRVHARELYPEVRVVGNPESMRAFRDYVQSGWLVNNCATNRCHGGEDARDLVLFNRKPTAARSVYTNFLVLDRSRTKDGHPLIDYQTPDRSPLLQMGLPREDAIMPHPDVPGWTPVFRSRDSRAFQRAVRWIQSMYEPRPEYPIQYTPPGQEPMPGPAETQGEPVER